MNISRRLAVGVSALVLVLSASSAEAGRHMNDRNHFNR